MEGYPRTSRWRITSQGRGHAGRGDMRVQGAGRHPPPIDSSHAGEGARMTGAPRLAHRNWLPGPNALLLEAPPLPYTQNSNREITFTDRPSISSFSLTFRSCASKHSNSWSPGCLAAGCGQIRLSVPA